ncbi:FCD domain-containing protein [Streptomyces sp. TLI_235]|nr:FCD domain-containing protein [Streptomyces sp. TLI_235]
MRRTPGAGALLAEAAASGLIDAVGGIDPAGFDGVGADAEGPAQLDQVFGLAEQHGLHLDIHLHDTGDRGLGPLRDIAARTRAAGLQGRVVVSHTFCVPELAGAAELATRNATPAELRGLEQVLARTRKAAEAGRLRETVGLDADFHRAIVELSGNPLLQDMMAPLDGRLRRLFRLTSGPESTSPMCTEHGQLLAAIRSGDPAAAADLARRYVAGTRAFALEVLGRGDA